MQLRDHSKTGFALFSGLIELVPGQLNNSYFLILSIAVFSFAFIAKESFVIFSAAFKNHNGPVYIFCNR
jgi:hypothetical protein